MISLILPYWDRQLAARNALLWVAACYEGLDLEVVIVDDGNRSPISVPETSLNVKVVHLPWKSEPKSPVTCWNEGVKAAKGEVIAISCIEVVHFKPVLPQMLSRLEQLGPDGYVLAAAWCRELNEWHAHSSKCAQGSFPLPEGTTRAFLGMMHKSLYEKAGGWDEDYRDGAGYEDIDFIYRMQRAGAKFLICDDLVVIHPKSGAQIHWPAEKFQRNYDLLRAKWA